MGAFCNLVILLHGNFCKVSSLFFSIFFVKKNKLNEMIALGECSTWMKKKYLVPLA